MGGWCSNDVHGLFRVGLCKNNERGWGKFFSHTKFKVRFWHAFGVGSVLEVAFMELFRIAHFKDVSMADHSEFFIDCL